MRRAVFLMGPTASGKSRLALEMAKRLDFEIVNCDSVQVYRHVDIGSAKPSREERQQVVHHLYDFVEPPQKFTAGEYRRKVLDLIGRTEKDLLFVGGTGFYFRALEHGMYESGPVVEENRIRMEKRLETEGAESLYRELSERDPAYAAKISPRDEYRLLRAMEMMESSGKTVTELQSTFQSQPFPLPLRKVVIQATREDLLPRIRLRVEQMIENGLLDEVRGLIERGLGTWSPLSSVGYKECVEYLSQPNVGVEALIEQIVTHTSQLAKRQRTWFKKESDADFIPFASFESMLGSVGTLTELKSR